MSATKPDGSTGENHVPFKEARVFVCGALSGAISKTAVAPFDRTKILMQVSNMHGWDSYRGGVLSSMRNILRTEGVLGFFRGNSATVARIMPYAALQYSGFEFYNEMLSRRVFGPDSKSPLKRFVAGSMAGTTSVLCTYPIDLARTVLAVEVGSRSTNVGVFGALRGIFRREGLAGLYRGAYPTIVGVIPYSGISFLSYGVFKGAADNTGLSEARPILTSMICGGSAGLLAQCCTYPLDMVRRRLQALHSPSMMTATERAFVRAAKSGNPSGVFKFSIYRAILFVYRQEGFRGIYRGVSLNFIKTAPAMSISFTCYDRLRTLFGVPSGKYSATTS